MSVTYVGNFGFGTGAPASVPKDASPYGPPICPLVVKAAGNAAIAISAAIDGLLALQAQITITPPNLTLLLDALIEFQAQCTAGIALGLPSVSFDLSASIQLIADLTASLTLLLALEVMLQVPVVAEWIGIPYPTPGTGLPVLAAPITATCDHALILVAADLPAPLSTGSRTALTTMLDGISYPGVGVFTNLGQMSIVTLNALAEARASIEYQLGLALNLKAFFKLNPPTFAASIDATIKFAAHLRAALALALPSIDFQFSAIARIVADLQLRFGILYLLGIALSVPFGELFVYRYDTSVGPGFIADFTLTLTPNFDGPSGFIPSSLPCQAAVIGGADPFTWNTLVANGGDLAFFGGAAA